MVIFSQIGSLAHAVDDLIRSQLQLWGGQNWPLTTLTGYICIHGVDEIAVDAINMLANTPWG